MPCSFSAGLHCYYYGSLVIAVEGRGGSCCKSSYLSLSLSVRLCFKGVNFRCVSVSLHR